MFDLRYCNSYAALFNPSFLGRVADGNHINTLSPLLRESSFEFDRIGTGKLADLFDAVYETLTSNYRCEYVYKNILANFLFNERHLSVQEASLLTELSAAGSIADAVVANGTTTAYEIKTDLDSFARLPVQLESYHQVFENVYVVVSESLVSRIKKIIRGDTGVIVLTRDNLLVTEREAVSNLDGLNVLSMFDTLRQKEYRLIIETEFGDTKDVRPAAIHLHCRTRAEQLNPVLFHSYFVEALKSRTSRNDTVECVIESPTALRALILSSEVSKVKLRRFIAALSCSFVEA